MKKFTSIKKLRHIVKYIKHQYMFDLVDGEYIYNPDYKCPILGFTGTVKLHGTNSSIRRTGGCYRFQSRNNEITVDSDNMGFASFASNIPHSELDRLMISISNDITDDIVIYGEWIGPKIQNGVGISYLENREFVIFSIMVNDEYIKNDKDISLHDYSVYNILEIPQYHVDICFEDSKSAVNIITKMVDEVENQCPWAFKNGIDGIGEGIVFTCDEDPGNSHLWFKAKGNKHKNVKSKNVIEIDPIVQDSIDKFIEYSVTEARLNQGVEYLIEQHLEIDMCSIGKYLHWMASDINKEEYDTLEVSGLTWKQVVQGVNNKTKNWFIAHIEDNL